VALIFIDLDNFKSINDTMGHSVGDVLLKETAVKLRDIIRATDTLCRLGGDEFLILLGDISEPEMITRVSEEVLQRLSEPCQIAGRDLYSTVSMGIAIYPEDGKNFETLLKAADTAMYQAKASGRATYRFYAEKMNQEAEQWQQIRNWLRQALDEDGFKLHYQPKISLVDGRLIGAEALLRLHLSDGTLLPPTEFIPIAEESGLILPIGAWVLRQACLDAARWRNEGATDFVIAVNISAPQFHRGDLVEQVVNALTDSGLPPEGLELELTESLLIENNDLILQTITQLSAMGVSFAIDDFGTGYSSLSYLKKFDIDFLKIDQSFTRNLAFGSSDMALSEAIIVMAHKLGLKVTAEGVETELQKELLATAGCDYAQGYLFSRPIPPEEFANLLGGNTGSS
jgi:diguanylate cyclase (GGDEF)-like protein